MPADPYAKGGYTVAVPNVPSSPPPVAPGSVVWSELTDQVYQQLRVIARTKLASQPPGHTLQATALVHEAFLKLRDHSSIFMAEPAVFYRVAAQAMRQILVDHARAKGRVKRGGGPRRDFADVAELAESHDPTEIMAFDEALSRLELQQPRAAEVVKLRFFAGLTLEETAQALGLSQRTVTREWHYARAWLMRALE